MTVKGLASPANDGVAAGLGAELRAVDHVLSEVMSGRNVPMAEVDGIVRALAVTIRGEHGVLLPLLEVRHVDEYAGSHCLNVAMLSMGLSEQLGLPDADMRAIGRAALLHDIGMTRIPSELLTKPAALTPDERLVIRTHAVEGARMLTARGLGNSLAATVAYEHHIWFNGTGGYPYLHYPRAPHFASRIVQVCDIYDAACSMRPYRDAWSREQGLDLIKSLAGLEVDPLIAEAFLAMAADATEVRQPVGEPTS